MIPIPKEQCCVEQEMNKYRKSRRRVHTWRWKEYLGTMETISTLLELVS